MIRSLAAPCVLGLLSCAGAQSDSFESVAPQAIPGDGIPSPFGRWTGAGEVSTHRARSGKQALRIFGGPRREVVLTLPKARTAVVRFWAERWTRRAPFRLEVEAQIDGAWRTVYEDSGREILVGGYRAHVKIAIEDRFRALRIRCSSPAESGLLLDDFEMVTPRPMRIQRVVAEQPALPMLVGKDRNPVLRVRIETTGTLEPIRLRGLRWTLASGKDLAECAFARVYHTAVPRFVQRGSTAVGDAAEAAAEMKFAADFELLPGANYLWLSVALRGNAVDLDGWLDGACVEVETSAGKVTPESAAPAGRQRFGVAVRDAGVDGVHTYRIPGIVTVADNTLVAVYDIRRRSGGDLPGDIDVGMSRSTDGGDTWEPMRVIMDMGRDPRWRFDGVGDPAILFDRQRQKIWVAATWSHGDRSWRRSGPGLTPDQTGQLMLVHSTDAGRTWSRPRNITTQVKDPKWAFVLQSPGRGIAMADGTLVFGAQFQAPPAEGRTPHATIMWSKDHGETWKIGKPARKNTTENQPVEIAPGRIMLNIRDNRRGLRSVLTTEDLGETWTPHPSDRKALVEPTCNAALLVVRPATATRAAWLVFVNPAVAEPPRRRMTVKLSTDGGLTWPAAQQVVLDEGESAGYPSCTRIDDETLGLLYEGSRAQMTFQRLKLAELSGGR